MAELAGKGGNVYVEPLLIEDCEDTWNETVVAGVVLSTVTGKTGNAARATTTTIGATTLLMSEAIVKNLTTYDAVSAWVRSSINTASDDLRLQLDDTASCASPLENLAIPALTAATWRLVSLKLANPSLLGSLISVGLYQNTDLADGTFDIDDVYALKTADSIRDWAIDYAVDALETTDFQSSGKREYIVGLSGWTGSFNGFKNGIPLTIGTIAYASFAESAADNNKTWNGQIIITGVSAAAPVDGVVTYNYTFTGTGPLEFPGA